MNEYDTLTIERLDTVIQEALERRKENAQSLACYRDNGLKFIRYKFVITNGPDMRRTLEDRLGRVRIRWLESIGRLSFGSNDGLVPRGRDHMIWVRLHRKPHEVEARRDQRARNSALAQEREQARALR